MATERLLRPDGSVAHPTQKPVALMERLLAVGAHLILDPFAGSGSTCIAALQEGFRWIGIEQDEESAAIARARIAHWQKQRQAEAPLFTEATDGQEQG